MVLAFGGIIFLLAAIVFVAIIGWVVFSYLTGTAEAADEGMDPIRTPTITTTPATLPVRRTASHCPRKHHLRIEPRECPERPRPSCNAAYSVRH